MVRTDFIRSIRHSGVKCYSTLSRIESSTGKSLRTGNITSLGSSFLSFQKLRSADVNEYKRVLQALMKKDSFQIWVSYLALRNYCYSEDSNPVLDRSIFMHVYLSLKPRNLLQLSTKMESSHKFRDGFNLYEGVRRVVPKEWPPARLPRLDEDALNMIEALPSERAYSTSNDQVRKFEMADNHVVEFWNRLKTVRQDIEKLFGPLKAVEMAHWLDCTRALGSLDSILALWTTIESDENYEMDVYMWNSLISGISRTNTSSLRRVPMVGNIEWTTQDVQVNQPGIYDDYVELSESLSRGQIKAMLSTYLDEASRKPDDTAVSQKYLQNSAKIALALTEEMIVSGVMPDSTTYEILMLAQAKSGNLAAVKAILKSVWNVDPDTDESGDTIPIGSRLYPSTMTCVAIYNSFGLNRDMNGAEKYVKLLRKKYNISESKKAVSMKWKLKEAIVKNSDDKKKFEK
ncbi:hypothetical protein V1511DRAFT_502216 [Dipodascopsis uninucleata]